jgi:hypothetical protein
MTTTRTKQQTAFDGVQVVWFGGDSFTKILQHQVQTKFSMDGVIPSNNTCITLKKRSEVHVAKEKVSVFIPKPNFGAIDGVRLPWEQVSTV